MLFPYSPQRASALVNVVFLCDVPTGSGPEDSKEMRRTLQQDNDREW